MELRVDFLRNFNDLETQAKSDRVGSKKFGQHSARWGQKLEKVIPSRLKPQVGLLPVLRSWLLEPGLRRAFIFLLFARHFGWKRAKNNPKELEKQWNYLAQLIPRSENLKLGNFYADIETEALLGRQQLEAQRLPGCATLPDKFDKAKMTEEVSKLADQICKNDYVFTKMTRESQSILREKFAESAGTILKEMRFASEMQCHPLLRGIALIFVNDKFTGGVPLLSAELADGEMMMELAKHIRLEPIMFVNRTSEEVWKILSLMDTSEMSGNAVMPYFGTHGNSHDGLFFSDTTYITRSDVRMCLQVNPSLERWLLLFIYHACRGPWVDNSKTVYKDGDEPTVKRFEGKLPFLHSVRNTKYIEISSTSPQFVAISSPGRGRYSLFLQILHRTVRDQSAKRIRPIDSLLDSVRHEYRKGQDFQRTKEPENKSDDKAFLQPCLTKNYFKHIFLLSEDLIRKVLDEQFLRLDSEQSEQRTIHSLEGTRCNSDENTSVIIDSTTQSIPSSMIAEDNDAIVIPVDNPSDRHPLARPLEDQADHSLAIPPSLHRSRSRISPIRRATSQQEGTDMHEEEQTDTRESNLEAAGTATTQGFDHLKAAFIWLESTNPAPEILQKMKDVFAHAQTRKVETT